MHRGIYPTDAGMHCLWDQAAFAGVTDYDSWERALLEDASIAEHIAAGRFVPLNISADGAMEIEVRIGTPQAPAELNARETNYLIVGSEPYFLRSQGQIGVCGIEYISTPPAADVGSFPLPAGDYAVTVHLLAWDEEPGMQTEDGPAPGALPDYLVLINPARPSDRYRTDIQTFPRPES